MLQARSCAKRHTDTRARSARGGFSSGKTILEISGEWARVGASASGIAGSHGKGRFDLRRVSCGDGGGVEAGHGAPFPAAQSRFPGYRCFFLTLCDQLQQKRTRLRLEGRHVRALSSKIEPSANHSAPAVDSPAHLLPSHQRCPRPSTARLTRFRSDWTSFERAGRPSAGRYHSFESFLALPINWPLPTRRDVRSRCFLRRLPPLRTPNRASSSPRLRTRPWHLRGSCPQRCLESLSPPVSALNTSPRLAPRSCLPCGAAPLPRAVKHFTTPPRAHCDYPARATVRCASSEGRRLASLTVSRGSPALPGTDVSYGRGIAPPTDHAPAIDPPK